MTAPIWTVHPCEVEIPNVGLFRAAKACWDGTTLAVYQADGQQPTLAWSGTPTARTLQHPTAPAHMFSTLSSDAGEITVRREPGCGCSSPLKHWNPS